MNFFEHQDIARKQTKRLIGLLALAVCLLIAATTLFVAGLFYWLQSGAIPSPERGNFWQNFSYFFDWQLLAGVAAGVIGVVALGSLYRLAQLQQGGATVAESLNGKLLNVSSCSVQEKRLLNIVEEMAIAAGVPVPPVYLLDEQGINAFAAGYLPRDAVIGVTRGCIEQLNREQLQGVIAHEYSHILHGDMRLNLRLVGILHGILLIGLIGQLLMRSSSRRSYSSKNNGGAALVAAGLGLVVLGYAGTLCGRLIKAAVSRQREFLADASAVQFTRNPQGISGALQRIGGYVDSSRISAANAEEYSHFYFADGLSSWVSSVMATHPPLGERIGRIDPRWNGKFDDRLTPAAEQNEVGTANEQVQGFAAQATSADTMMEQAGTFTEQHLVHASALIAQLDPLLNSACHEPLAAQALIYCLLSTESVRQQQHDLLQRNLSTGLIKLCGQLEAPVQALTPAQRMPLIELCLPALKSLSAVQLQLFRRDVIALIKADDTLTLAEWCIFRLLEHNLFNPPPSMRSHRSLASVLPLAKALVAAIAIHGNDDDKRQIAYDSALAALDLEAENLPAIALPLRQLDKVLVRLNQLKPLQKPRLLKALTAAVNADGKVSVSEYELMRVIADSLDCPMPPLLNQ